MSDLYDCRVAFADTLEELARRDARIVAVVNDSVSSGKLTGFRETFPERLVNVGIAEQNMVGVAAGLANGGKIPFVSSAACFLTGRALEQIKVDVAYTGANIKLCGQSPGLAYGALGATHHSIEDLAWMRAIADLTVIVPCDPEETAQSVRAAAEHEGPVYLRIGRMPVPAVHGPEYRFEVGRADCLRDGHHATIIACGTMVAQALEAARQLEHFGVDARVINMSTIRPIDRQVIEQAASETGAIVTVEEHTTYGGLGSAVAEVVVATCPVPMRMVGVPGVFAPTGSTAWLFGRYGLTAEGIRKAALQVVSRKRGGGA